MAFVDEMQEMKDLMDDAIDECGLNTEKLTVKLTSCKDDLDDEIRKAEEFAKMLNDPDYKP